jgi:hypothetical protein
LLWIEGFETFGTSVGSSPTGLGTKYTQNVSSSNTILATGRVSGIALKPHNAVSPANIQTPAVGSNPTMIVGLAYQPGDAINDDGRVVGFYQDNTEHFTLRAQSSGEVSAYRGTTHIATSSGAGLATNAWCYIEVRAKIGNAGTGAYEMTCSVCGIACPSASTCSSSSSVFVRTNLTH